MVRADKIIRDTMRKYCFIIVLSLLLIQGCSSIFVNNNKPVSKLLISDTLGWDGGFISYQNNSSAYNGVSISAQKRAIQTEATFSIYYFESFPYKPKNMDVKSIAYEFKYNTLTHRRVKIGIPYDDSVDPATNGVALFRLNLKSKTWHFAGGSEIVSNNNLVYALIDRPGIFAVLSLTKELPDSVSTDFRVGFDNFNANQQFLSKYNDAAAAFSFWFNNNRRTSNINLYSQFRANDSMYMLQAAQHAYQEHQFTSSTELSEEPGMNQNIAVNYMKTGLVYEGKPIAVVLDAEHTVLIFKYKNLEFSVYDPKENNLVKKLTYDPVSGIFDYESVSILTLAFFGDFGSCDDSFIEITDYFDSQLYAVQADSIGPQGGSIIVTSGELSGLSIQIPQGALLDYKNIEIFNLVNPPNSPTEALRLQTSFRLLGIERPFFERPIEIVIPYADVDNDGFVDNTGVLEDEIFAAAYNYSAASWAQAKVVFRDTVNNYLICETARTGDFCLFGFVKHIVTPSTGNSGVFVYHSWPSGESVSDVLDKLQANKINKLYISAFECDGDKRFKIRFSRSSGMPDHPGYIWAYNWFVYDTLIQEAKKRNIEIIFAITCWNSGKGVNVDNVEDYNSHAGFIVENIVDFILNYCPEVSGIMLDYVRYDIGNYTEAEKDVVVKFLQRVREKIGKKGLNAPRLYVDVWASNGEDGRDNVGQRYSDFACYADDLVVMLYGGNNPPLPSSSITKYVQRGLMPCTQENKCSLIAAIQTYSQATAASVDSQIFTSLKNKAQGFAVYRYSYTEADEWQSISRYCLQ